MGIPKGNYRSRSLREHFVYRYFDAAGRLLYVGRSMRLAAWVAAGDTERRAS